jgi:gluconate kinase
MKLKKHRRDFLQKKLKNVLVFVNNKRKNISIKVKKINTDFFTISSLTVYFHKSGNFMTNDKFL